MKDKYPYEMDVSTSNTSIARDRKLHPIRSSRKLSIPNLKCHDSVARDVVAAGLFACLTRETAEGRGAITQPPSRSRAASIASDGEARRARARQPSRLKKITFH